MDYPGLLNTLPKTGSSIDPKVFVSICSWNVVQILWVGQEIKPLVVVLLWLLF